MNKKITIFMCMYIFLSILFIGFLSYKSDDKDEYIGLVYSPFLSEEEIMNNIYKEDGTIIRFGGIGVVVVENKNNNKYGALFSINPVIASICSKEL